jgi:hypothetical protein
VTVEKAQDIHRPQHVAAREHRRSINPYRGVRAWLHLLFRAPDPAFHDLSQGLT